jgi:hypothetical protein
LRGKQGNLVYAKFKVTRYNTIRKSFFRIVALALLAVSAAFSFPENHYSVEKTFVKSPTPQTEACSLLANDIEDSDDYSTDADFFHDFLVSRIDFPTIDIASTKMLKDIAVHSYDAVYLRLRQLLI